jgi:glycogen debranching enzyme
MLADGLIGAAQWFDGHALPELFCGYDRAETPFPVDYPVACSPQAWSAGATIMLVTMLAGISPGKHGVHVAPLSPDRKLRLAGVPFHGKRLVVDAQGAPEVRTD